MITAEFHDVIGQAIPSLIELLRSEGYGMRSSVVSVLLKLAATGELHPKATATELTHTQSQIS